MSEQTRRKSNVPRNEWDFSPLKYVENYAEVFLCWVWEHTREIPSFRAAVLAARNGAKLFDVNRYRSGDPNYWLRKGRIGRNNAQLLLESPEWPETPFLNLTKTRRDDLNKQLSEGDLFDDPDFSVDMDSFTSEPYNYGEKIETKSEVTFLCESNDSLNQEEPFPIVTAVVRLNLNRSIQSLKQDFTTLLGVIEKELAARKHNDTKGSVVKAKGKRGRSASINKLKVQLKELGALRISKKMNQGDAEVFTHLELGDGALYVRSNWGVAVKHAKVLLSEFGL